MLIKCPSCLRSWPDFMFDPGHTICLGCEDKGVTNASLAHWQHREGEEPTAGSGCPDLECPQSE